MKCQICNTPGTPETQPICAQCAEDARLEIEEMRKVKRKIQTLRAPREFLGMAILHLGTRFVGSYAGASWRKFETRNCREILATEPKERAWVLQLLRAGTACKRERLQQLGYTERRAA